MRRSCSSLTCRPSTRGPWRSPRSACKPSSDASGDDQRPHRCPARHRRRRRADRRRGRRRAPRAPHVRCARAPRAGVRLRRRRAARAERALDIRRQRPPARRGHRRRRRHAIAVVRSPLRAAGRDRHSAHRGIGRPAGAGGRVQRGARRRGARRVWAPHDCGRPAARPVRAHRVRERARAVPARPARRDHPRPDRHHRGRRPDGARAGRRPRDVRGAVTLGRIVALVLLAAGGLGGSALFATRLLGTLSVPPAASPDARPPVSITAPAAQDPLSKDGRHRGHQRERARDHAVGPNATKPVRRGDRRASAKAKEPRLARIRTRARRAELEPRILGLPVALLVALEAASGTLGLATTALALAVRRTRARRRRVYELYTLHLSPHDEAKPQDLEDMLEAIANLVRAFPTDRARTGQSFLAFELLHLPGPSGELEWSIAARCEPKIAVALDAALSAAYPDVRLGHVGGTAPQPHDMPLAEPGHVMRFRKQRGFIYPLVAAGDELASPPLEAIAHAQASLGVPSAIRFTLTPAPVWLEGVARALYRHHENRLVRQERWGLPEGG